MVSGPRIGVVVGAKAELFCIAFARARHRRSSRETSTKPSAAPGRPHFRSLPTASISGPCIAGHEQWTTCLEKRERPAGTARLLPVTGLTAAVIGTLQHRKSLADADFLRVAMDAGIAPVSRRYPDDLGSTPDMSSFQRTSGMAFFGAMVVMINRRRSIPDPPTWPWLLWKGIELTVIVLIRRVAKKDYVDEFLAQYERERPSGRPGFITEYLTRVEGADIPGVRELGLLHPSVDGVAFLNVAFWETEEAFIAAFNPKPGFFDPDTECEPRKRAILRIENMAGPLPSKV